MKKAKTKDGQPARIYATDGHNPYIYHGAFLSDDGWEVASGVEAGGFLN